MLWGALPGLRAFGGSSEPSEAEPREESLREKVSGL